MIRSAFITAAVLVGLTVSVAPSVIARVQVSGPRYEYLRLTPYSAQAAKVPYGIRIAGYHACLAAGSDWQCRDFESAAADYTGGATLSVALNTLGNESWELVSATHRTDDGPFFGTATYLFKRSRQ